MTTLTLNTHHPVSAHSLSSSSKHVWAGRLISGLAVLFMAFDTAIKVAELHWAVEGTTSLGFPASTVVWIGLVELVCLIAYLIPRTAPLGAILWTGYLGGAIATHVRMGAPLLSHTLFPLFVAAFIWGGLVLRDARVRALMVPRAD